MDLRGFFERTEVLRAKLGIEGISVILRRNRLRWFRHLERRDERDWIRRSQSMVVEGRRPAG